MKYIFLVVFIGLTGLAAYAGHDGNGGGGIYRGGRYMTFYSAGFYTDPSELTVADVLSLKDLVDFFNSTPYLSQQTKGSYISSLIPTSARKYYRVQSSTFTPEIRDRLLAEYARVMKADIKELSLYAVTDTQSNTTFLFPEFFLLSPTGREAILYHEARWILNPNSTYKSIIDSEMAFQAYLENINSKDRLLQWLTSMGTQVDTLTAAIQIDLASGALNGMLKDNHILAVADLYGDKFFDCKAQGLKNECTGLVKTHLYELINKFPDSALLKVFLDSLVRDKFQLEFNSVPGYPQYGYINMFDFSFKGDDRNTTPDYLPYIKMGYIDLQIPIYESTPKFKISFAIEINEWKAKITKTKAKNWSFYDRDYDLKVE
jgi:hypothetical protein